MLAFPGAMSPPGQLAVDDPLLVTKLHLTLVSDDLVARPYLVASLAPVPGRPRTLVCAPTSFGKTTLVRAWAEETPRPVAWLSLDASDDVPTRFWRYVIAAIRAWHADFGDQPRAIALSRLALDLTPGDSLTLRRAIALNLGIAHWWNFDAEESERALRASGALAEAVGDSCAAVVALCHRGKLNASRGYLRRARELFQQAEDLARERDVSCYPSQSFMHLGVADVLLEWGELYEAARRLDECVRLGAVGGKIDLVIENVVVVPIVFRLAVAAASGRLRGYDSLGSSPWAPDVRNIAHWYFEE